MAKRNYTTEALEQITQTIEKIDNADVSPVKEFFSDLLLRIGQFLELFTVEQYEENMQKWYDIVLDSHNYTISEVKDIFRAVGETENEYQKIMSDAVSGISSFRSTLNTLRDVISGKITLADGKVAADRYLAAGKSSLITACDTILTKVQQEALWDASKDLFGDAIKLGLARIKLIKGGDVSDYKNLADTYLATWCDLLAMGSIVIAPLSAWADSRDGKMDMSYEDYIDAQFMLLSPAQKLKDVNSVSDLLKNLAEDMDEQVAKHPEGSPEYYKWKKRADIAQGVSDHYDQLEFAVDLYGIGKDLKDIHDTADSWKNGKPYTEAEYKKLYDQLKDKEILGLSKEGSEWIYRLKVSRVEKIGKGASNLLGIPFSGWYDSPSKTLENGLKVLGTLWSYGEKLIPDPGTGQPNSDALPDVFFGKFKDTKFLKDVFDFARDLDEFAHKTPDVVPQKQCGTTGSNWFQCEMGVN